MYIDVYCCMYTIIKDAKFVLEFSKSIENI